MSHLKKHIIQQPRPYRYAIFILLAIIITATAQWLWLKDDSTSLQKNLKLLQQDLTLSQENSQQLNDERADLREQNKQLNVATTKQKLEISIQQSTVDSLQQQLVDLQSHVLTLNKELLFYQNITQGGTSSKLQIRELHLTADLTQSDIIHYRLVITQGKRISTPMKGTVSISIDTNPAVISKKTLSLRYVQLIEGQLKIADLHHVKSITITVKPAKKPTLSRTFDWQLTSTTQY